MAVTLKQKTLALTLLPMTAVLILVGGAAVYNKRSSEQSLLLNRVTTYRSLLESGDLGFSTIADKQRMESLLDESVNRVVLIRNGYDVLFSTDSSLNTVSAAGQFTDAEKGLITQAYQGTETNEIVTVNNTSALEYVSPIIVNNNLVAVLFQNISFEKSNRRITQYAFFVFALVTAGIVICFIILNWLLGWAILAPIYKLKTAASGMSQGDLSIPVPMDTNDEIGDLGRTFDEMRTKVTNYQAELLASIRSLPFGFILIGPENEVVLANGNTAKLLGRSKTASVNQTVITLEEIVQELGTSVDILKCIEECRKNRRDVIRSVTYGSSFYHLIFSPIIAEGKRGESTIGTVFIIQDYTEEKALERSRDEFFSIASHELRTPLTAIRGNTSIILQYFKKEIADHPEVLEMLGDIYDSSLRLIEIVNDFLMTSRLEQGRVDYQIASFDIALLIQETLRTYEMSEGNELHPHVKIELELPDTPQQKVLADPDRVRQILINLISNGLKFTEKGKMTIQVEMTASRAHVRIRDTGMGIPLKSQHLLFRKFQQASNNILVRDNTRGTGLGLYISRLMAEGMKGKLYLEGSEVGKGSSFMLELPLAKGE